MRIDVLSTNGSTTGRQVDLNEEVFGIAPNDHCIYLAVKQYRASLRQGTHKSKERSEIAGSRKKLKKQKGSGAARYGDIKNPLFKGGGRVFGPKPRNYDTKLNKKVKQLARNSALSYKAKDNNLVVLQDFTFDDHKTKNFVELLKSLNIENKKTLLVLKDADKNVLLAARNLKKVTSTSIQALNTYDILNANTVVFVESAIGEIV